MQDLFRSVEGLFWRRTETDLETNEERNLLATFLRVVCRFASSRLCPDTLIPPHAATVCIMAMEAWMKTAKPGEKFDMTEAPSEVFDRQEVVVLMGEDQAGQKQTFRMRLSERA